MNRGIFLMFIIGSVECQGQTLLKNDLPKPDSMSRLPIVMPFSMHMPVPPNYYTADFGFFCKQELKLEKVNIPLKLRLGLPDQCSYLESKGRYIPIQK
jgi:hypothetical protein